MQAAPAEETRQALYAPLLGDEACRSQEYNHHQHHDHDDNSDNVADTMMMMMDDDDDDDDITTNLCCNDTVNIWVILLCLLLIQVGMAFLMHDESTTHLSWSISVNFSIFLYWVTAWLYQHAVQDSKIETVLVLLLPEILMGVIMVIVWLDKVPLGLGSTCAFVVPVLFCGSRNNGHDDREQEEVQEEKKIAIAQVCIV
jgi:hypothetical protein